MTKRLNHKPKSNTMNRTTHKPVSNETFFQLVHNTIRREGNDCDLNFIDTSDITSMDGLFTDSEFNGDISQWDTSNVKRMDDMFAGSEFNGDISQWDTSKVEDMGNMFTESKFDGDISKWNTFKVVNYQHIYDNAPISSKPSKQAKFNQLDLFKFYINDLTCRSYEEEIDNANSVSQILSRVLEITSNIGHEMVKDFLSLDRNKNSEIRKSYASHLRSLRKPVKPAPRYKKTLETMEYIELMDVLHSTQNPPIINILKDSNGISNLIEIQHPFQNKRFILDLKSMSKSSYKELNHDFTIIDPIIDLQVKLLDARKNFNDLLESQMKTYNLSLAQINELLEKNGFDKIQ